MQALIKIRFTRLVEFAARRTEQFAKHKIGESSNSRIASSAATTMSVIGGETGSNDFVLRQIARGIQITGGVHQSVSKSISMTR